MPNPLILALDVPRPENALDLVRELTPVVTTFKVGSELFTSAGPQIVHEIRRLGGGVFLDLKFHDIPNTVAAAVAAAVELDVQMLTVHTAGGPAMLKAAEKAALDRATALGRKPPLVLGVTVLTSLDNNELSEIGYARDVARQVEHFASMAAQCGLRGLVCSPLEIVQLRTFLPSEMKLVTPGIRPAGSETGDQKRTLTPAEALEAGADWLVIGRPIYTADDPRAAAEAILATLPG
jgi:orotidine-5'-phosphate decarboxylase